MVSVFLRVCPLVASEPLGVCLVQRRWNGFFLVDYEARSIHPFSTKATKQDPDASEEVPPTVDGPNPHQASWLQPVFRALRQSQPVQDFIHPFAFASTQIATFKSLLDGEFPSLAKSNNSMSLRLPKK